MNEAALENTDGLADTEIARLITLSNQASYSRSDILPVREPSPFEPKSLVEIAMAAQKRRDEANAHAAAEKAHADQNPTEQATAEQVVSPEQSVVEASDDASTASSVDEAESLATDNTTSMAPSETDTKAATAVDQEGDAGSEPEKGVDAVTDDAENVSVESADTQAESPSKPDSKPPEPAIPDPALLEAEYKRGQEAGLAEGQAKAAEQLEKVLQNFEQAIQALAKPEALDVSALSARIASRVMALASDRAGQAITDMPEPFAKRVEDLINMVKSETASPTIHLNAEDHASINPLAQNRDKLKNCKFVVDDALARGDIKMSVGGVGLIDEMSDRTNTRMADDEADTSQQSSAIADTNEDSKSDEVVEIEAQPDTSATDVTETPAIDEADVKAEPHEAPSANKTVDEIDNPEVVLEEKTEITDEKAETSAEDMSEELSSTDKDASGDEAVDAEIAKGEDDNQI